MADDRAEGRRMSWSGRLVLLALALIALWVVVGLIAGSTAAFIRTAAIGAGGFVVGWFFGRFGGRRD